METGIPQPSEDPLCQRIDTRDKEEISTSHEGESEFLCRVVNRVKWRELAVKAFHGEGMELGRVFRWFFHRVSVPESLVGFHSTGVGALDSSYDRVDRDWGFGFRIQ